MKNKIGLVISIIFVMLITGCVNYNACVRINKDKSMNYSVIFMVDDELYNSNAIKDSIEVMKHDGLNVSDYFKDGLKGYKIEMQIDNIDKISDTNDVTYVLSNIPDNNTMFKVEKSFFTNKYTANFVFDKTQYEIKKNKSQDIILEDYIEQADSALINENVININKTIIKFNVVLPSHSLSNNATSSLDNSKNLIWNITSDVQNINFAFELPNILNIKLTILGVVALIVVMIILYIKKRMTPTKGVKPVTIDVDTVVSNTTEMVQNVQPNTFQQNQSVESTQSSVEQSSMQSNVGLQDTENKN